MDALTALTTRTQAARLTDPAPDAATLDRILAAALRAPDHGRLRPWRLIVIEGEARQRLGALWGASLMRREPSVLPELVVREQEKPLRAPMTIVVAAKVIADHPKIPAVEQVLSAAAATQNILLAAHASGFGAMWKTGQPAYDPEVKKALGLDPGDAIVAFIHLGTVDGPTPTIRPVEAARHVSRWGSAG